MALLTVPEIVQLFPVFKGKLGYRVANMLRKHLSVDKVSDLEDRNSMFQGADFAGACLDDLRIDVQVGNPERLASLPEGAFITISNHPYGGVDGIMLIDLIGHLRSEFKVIVNEFLSQIECLHPSMIFVNPKIDDNSVITPTNLQGIREIMRHIRDGYPLGIFPSVRLGPTPAERRICDREWQPSVLKSSTARKFRSFRSVSSTGTVCSSICSD